MVILLATLSSPTIIIGFVPLSHDVSNRRFSKGSIVANTARWIAFRPNSFSSNINRSFYAARADNLPARPLMRARNLQFCLTFVCESDPQSPVLLFPAAPYGQAREGLL